MSWGDVKNNKDQQRKFLRDLTNGTPSQTLVIKINADEF